MAVKTQLLRYVFLSNRAKSYSHHYPGLLGRFGSRSGIQNNSEIIFKLT